MKSQQTTAIPTAQYSSRQESSGQEPPGQEPIYLLEKELGHGDFSTIYKAVDISTGDVHAVKKFHYDN